MCKILKHLTTAEKCKHTHTLSIAAASKCNRRKEKRFWRQLHLFCMNIYVCTLCLQQFFLSCTAFRLGLCACMSLCLCCDIFDIANSQKQFGKQRPQATSNLCLCLSLETPNENDLCAAKLSISMVSMIFDARLLVQLSLLQLIQNSITLWHCRGIT